MLKGVGCPEHRPHAAAWAALSTCRVMKHNRGMCMPHASRCPACLGVHEAAPCALRPSRRPGPAQRPRSIPAAPLARPDMHTSSSESRSQKALRHAEPAAAYIAANVAATATADAAAVPPPPPANHQPSSGCPAAAAAAAAPSPLPRPRPPPWSPGRRRGCSTSCSASSSRGAAALAPGLPQLLPPLQGQGRDVRLRQAEGRQAAGHVPVQRRVQAHRPPRQRVHKLHGGGVQRLAADPRALGGGAGRGGSGGWVVGAGGGGIGLELELGWRVVLGRGWGAGLGG